MMKSMKPLGGARQRFRGDSTTSSSSSICLDEEEEGDEEKNNDTYSSKKKKKGRTISITRRISKTRLLLVLVVLLVLMTVISFYSIIIPMISFTIQVITLIVERKFILPNACDVAIQSKLYLSQEKKKQDDENLVLSSPTSSGSGSRSGSRGGLPKIIHQVWKDENIPTGRFADVHAAWKRFYPEPEYQHMLWTDETGRNLIETEFSWFLPTYDAYPMNIQRADVMRYFILYKYGGVYADLDYEPLANFWEYFSRERVSLIESPYILNERVQNSLMASPPQHAFWNASFQILLQHSHDDSLLASTGPAAMDATMDVYNPNNSPDVGPYILPCQNFHRIPIFGLEFRQRSWEAQLDQLRRFYSREVKSCGDWIRTNDCQFGIHHNSVSYDTDLIRYNKEVERKKKKEQYDQFIVSNQHFLAITKQDPVVNFGLWGMNHCYHEFLNGGSFLAFSVTHNNGRIEDINHRLGTSPNTQVGTNGKGMLVTTEIIEHCGTDNTCETVVEIKSEWSIDDETGATTSNISVSVFGERSSTDRRNKVQLSRFIFGVDQISSSQCHQLVMQPHEEEAVSATVDISTTTTSEEDPPVQLIWEGDPKRRASFGSVNNSDGCLHYATMSYDLSNEKSRIFTFQNTFHAFSNGPN